MRAVRLHQFGGPNVLRVDDIPVPEPGEGEVLIKVAAASVNPVDYKIRRGGYPLVKPENLPITLGRDVAGTIERSNAKDFSLGDQVYGHMEWAHGAQAEYAIVSRAGLALKPAALDLVEAAAVPLAAATAWQGLFTHGDLRSGQTVLIHGGSGGVGGFAVQFARAIGAKVCTTASGEGVALAQSYGADRVIDYKRAAFEDEFDQVDLVFDLIGGATQEKSWKVLREGGALVSTVQEPDQGQMAAKQARGRRYMAEPNGDQLKQVAKLIDEGQVRVVVARRFALEEAADAHRLLEQTHPLGKLLLVP